MYETNLKLKKIYEESQSIQIGMILHGEMIWFGKKMEKGIKTPPETKGKTFQKLNMFECTMFGLVTKRSKNTS